LSNEINVLFVTMQLFEQEGDTDRLWNTKNTIGLATLFQ
jgi:hypothetical protein